MPIQTTNWRDEMQRIQEEAAKLGPELTKLAKLQADADFFAATEKPEDTGPRRAAALERGTAAAFSASFGAMPKVASQQLHVLKEIRDQQKKIDAVQRMPIGR